MTTHAFASLGNSPDWASLPTAATTTRRRSADIVELPVALTRLALTQPHVAWAEEVRDRLNHLCQLPVGWDGYRGRPTRFDVAHFAFDLLRHVCRATTPAPSIVPLPSGGLQIEWHHDAADIELTVPAPSNVEAWVADPALGDDGEERLLETDFAFIVPWVKRLG